MRTLARFLGRVLLSFVLGLGWLALFVVLLLWIGEKSGWLTVLVRDAIAREAGSLGADLAIGDVSLDWFALEVRLEDIELGVKGDAVHLRDMRVCFGFEGAGIELERAEIDGGHVRLSPALFNGIRGFSSRMAAREARRAGQRRIPTLLVRDLQVDYDTARFGRVPIAKVELLLESDAAGEATLSGHAIPSLSASPSGSGEIYLSGQQPEPGGFAVRAWATKLPISTDYLPRETELEFLRAWKPGGTLGLEAEARFRLDGTGAARGTARLALEDGRVLVLGKHPVDALRADLEVALAPSAGDLSDASAWRARARIDGRLDGFAFTLVGRHGGTDDASARAQVSVHLPELPLTEKLLALLGGAPANVVRWNAFDARGTAEVSLAARLPASSAPSAQVLDTLEIGLEVALDGDAGLSYHGWPNRRTGVTDQGFPLPIDAVRGAVVFARAPARPRPAVVGLVDLEGTSAIGKITGFGTIVSHPTDAPAYLPGHGNGEIDLSFASPRLAVGAELERALAGLAGVIREEDVWQAYRPSGGAVGVDLRLVRHVEMESVATGLTIDVEDVGLAWSELPIPLERARGRVHFLADGHGEHGVGVALASGMRTAQDLAIALRLQSEPRARARESSGALSELEVVDLSVERMSLTGDDKQILVARYPVIESAMAEMQPRGFADVLYRRVRDGAGAATRTTSEISTREVQIQPRQFRMNTNAVRGRVLIDAYEPRAATAAATDARGSPANGHPPLAGDKERVDTRLMPLVGLWGQDVQVAFFADFAEDRVHIFGAGIDPSNKGLLGALAQSIQGPGAAAGIDMTTLGARGLIDFTGEIELVDEPEEGPAPSPAQVEPRPAREAQKYGRLFLRGNELAAANFHLEGLRGVLDWRNGVITGNRLQARLADTPVTLSELSFTSGSDGFRLDTRISAENLPLDREHLRSFLDAETLDALLGELRWRGRLDVEDGRITITGPPSGEGRLEFRGKVTPNDMFVQLGLPISIRSATARIEELILEGGRLRGVVRIDDLYGQVADRELGPANLLVTYVEPRLSIENLEGELEGGHVLPLGADAERGGTAFSLDLEEPFPFQLALELRDVEVAGLLRGLFPSNIATRGLLSCELRLVGNTENLLGIEGSGSFQVRETRLWSVPVFRALFSQLGFDNTAVFDRMATNVRVRKGVIEMNDIAIHSPLLQLVGEGTLDFDGSLEHDLDVRYDLVDRLGPLTRLLYAIQNKLLSISIRGDMSRPEVILKSPFQGLFGGWKTRERALPLPEYAPLPARF